MNEQLIVRLADERDTCIIAGDGDGAQLLDEAIAALKKFEWQPITDAPKTRILGWCVGDYEVIVTWDRDSEVWRDLDGFTILVTHFKMLMGGPKEAQA